MHGAVYGKGIYLSPHSSVSFGYSGMGHGVHTKIRKQSSRESAASGSGSAGSWSTEKPVEPTVKFIYIYLNYNMIIPYTSKETTNLTEGNSKFANEVFS